MGPVFDPGDLSVTLGDIPVSLYELTFTYLIVALGNPLVTML